MTRMQEQWNILRTDTDLVRVEWRPDITPTVTVRKSYNDGTAGSEVCFKWTPTTREIDRATKDVDRLITRTMEPGQTASVTILRRPGLGVSKDNEGYHLLPLSIGQNSEMAMAMTEDIVKQFRDALEAMRKYIKEEEE